MKPVEPTTLSEAMPAAAGAASLPQAFEAELVRSRSRLFRTALLLLGSREAAEDATQAALVKALEGRAQFRGGSGVYTWLYRILVNQCKDAWKAASRAARWLEPQAGAAALAVADPAPGAEARLVAGERREAVRRALGRLDPAAREILVLRHYQEMSYEQIAGVQGVPIGTVRSRLFAARERFRTLLREEGPA